LPAGTALWSLPLCATHTPENSGEPELRAISVELKDSKQAGAE
jgi:hypothetical protein